MQNVADFEQKEQTVQDAREYAESIVETVREPLIVLDADLKVISANRAFYQTFKTKPEETEGQLIYNIGNQQWNIPKLRELLEEILPNNTSFDNYEVEHEFPHIGKRTMLLNARRIPQPPAKPRIILLAIEDITSQKEAEDKLRENTGKYERLFHSSPDFIAEVDENGVFLAVNNAMAKSLGTVPERVIGKSYLDFLPKNVAEKRGDLARRALAEKTIQVLEDERAGRYFYTMFVPGETSAGKKTIQVIAKDLTSIKMTQKNLQESEKKYRQLIEMLNEGIWVIDKNAITTFVNPRMAEMLGYTTEEMMGKHLFSFMTEQGKKMAAENLEQRQKGVKEQHDFEFIKKDGSRIYALLETSPITDETGTYQGAIAGVQDITERKTAEEKLRQSEERYRKQFDEAIDAIFLADPKTGMIVDCNIAATTLVRRGKSEIIGKHQSFLHPVENIADGVSKTFKSHVTGDASEIIEDEVITKSGQIKYVTIRASKITIEGKEVLQGIFHDITGRKYMEKALESSELQYRRLFESAKDGIILLDFDTGKIIDANPFIIDLLGYSKTDLLDKYLWEISTLKDVATAKNNFLELQTKEYIRYEDLPLEKKDGKKIDVEFVSNVYDVDGRKTIQCNIRDITERKRAEQDLRESKALVDAVVENVPLMIFLKEATDLRFVIFNRAGEELLGHDRKDLLGKNNLELFPPEQAANFMTKDREVLDGEAGMLDIPEEPILTAKKGQRLLHTRKVCIRGVDGTTKFLLGISEDITERKRAEEELKVADIKLKESFQKIQKQKNELERKSRNLEETNRNLDGFAYSVSHDLRAPLRSVSGFSQVLLDEYKDKADNQMKHYLERIFAGTQKMGDLIDALLNFSRTTRADLKYETVDVEKIITNILKDQTAAHPERTIDFVVQPLPMVEADGKMVEVIFRNLIENAVKFTSKRKEAHIEIGSRQDKDEQQFFVKDNGAGFDMKFESKLFGAFQRLHSESEFEGNGIGLAMVARLVTKHGGRVWANGEVDKGATFNFTLPLKTSSI